MLNGVMGVWRSAEGGLAEMAEEYMARESSPLARPERREMSAEPEDIAAVEGDKFMPCPTCGGPCRRVQVGKREGFGYQHYVTESLVKGEVVAKGWAGPRRWRSRWDGKTGRLVSTDFIPVWLNYQPRAGEPVCVIRARE